MKWLMVKRKVNNNFDYYWLSVFQNYIFFHIVHILFTIIIKIIILNIKNKIITFEVIL